MATMSRPGVRVKRLQDQTGLGYNSSVAIQTAGQIPAGRRVLAVKFSLLGDFTQPAAGAALQSGESLRALIATCVIGRRVNLSGLGLSALAFLKRGRHVQFPGDIPANVNEVHSRKVEWWILYLDPTARSPNDGGIPAELWTDQIEVRLNSNAIFAVTAPTLGNATLRTEVYHDAAPHGPNKATLPISLQMVDQQFNTLDAVIQKAGLWKYAVLFTEAGLGVPNLITSANISQLSSFIDGEPQLDALTMDDACDWYNGMRAAGASRADSTAAPTLQTVGESLSNQPGTTAAAGQGISTELVPLLIPPNPFNLNQLPRAASGFSARLAGTIGAYRIAYELVEARNESQLGAGGRKLGIARGRAVAKLASKGGIPEGSDLALYTPTTLHGS